jgi:hypothetical protein
MAVGCQLHALAALPPGEIRLGVLQGRSARARKIVITRKSEITLLSNN